MTTLTNEFAERWQFNLSAVKAWNDDNWTHWFLTTFREKDYRPLRLSPRQSPISEIEELYRHETEDHRFQMKRGLTRAIAEWEADFHGVDTLRSLAWTASKIRATETIPALLNLLIANRTTLTWRSPFFDAADTVLNVIAGFAPDDRIERAFTSLFYDSAPSPHFSATLALGISICNQDRFAEVFNRFVNIKTQLPNYFVDVDIMRQFNLRLTKKTLWDNMGRLSTAAHRYARETGIEAGVFTRADLVGFDNETSTAHDSSPLAFPVTTHNALYEEAADRIRLATAYFQGKHPTLLQALAYRLDAP